MEVLVSTIVAFAAGFFLAKRRKETEENQGEAAVRKMLVRWCRGSTSHILNNVTLRYADGTTQIDHILITEKGILIIETKHYKGWIFANSNSRQWMQVIYKMKNKFQNPLHQNSMHVRAVQQLLDFLPKENIRGVVVFTGEASFKTGIPSGVVHFHQLQNYVENFRFAELSENRVQFCVGRIECQRQEITATTDIEHQKYLERKFGVVNYTQSIQVFGFQ